MKACQKLMYLAMAFGLDSKREGFMNPYSWMHNTNVWGLNAEVYTGTDLDHASLSSRAGESIQVHFENLGLPDYFPDKLFLHLRATKKLETRTASARLFA